MSVQASVCLGDTKRRHQLPPELWAKVLSHLNLLELLQARLVCKDFICLDQNQSLSLHWNIAGHTAFRHGQLAALWRSTRRHI
ncbi:hypothetical protein WJX74_006322 [Apatococcus lobatus]|uniref:F-box domain-containing protein n=1 Tax=Apatococcus lobatus TaxID=904363 RepID=A0AAW1S054_9CHLO